MHRKQEPLLLQSTTLLTLPQPTIQPIEVILLIHQTCTHALGGHLRINPTLTAHAGMRRRDPAEASLRTVPGGFFVVKEGHCLVDEDFLGDGAVVEKDYVVFEDEALHLVAFFAMVQDLCVLRAIGVVESLVCRPFSRQERVVEGSACRAITDIGNEDYSIRWEGRSDVCGQAITCFGQDIDLELRFEKGWVV